MKNFYMTAMTQPRVLVVEDLPEMRAMLRSVLESMGYEVDEATNRKDGIAMLMGDPEIGIVLLDLGLPPAPEDFSEGITFLKEAAGRGSLAMILVLTGQVVSEATLAAVEHGAFDYLTKPFQPELLRAAIERAMFYYQRHSQLRGSMKVAVHVVADASNESSMQRIKDELMIRLFRAVLAETRHNVSQAARRLNMTREHLYYYLKKYSIDRQ